MSFPTEQLWPGPDGAEWLLKFEWATVEERVQLIGFCVRSFDGDRPVTASVLRSIPLGRIVEDEARKRIETLRDSALHGPDKEAAARALPKYERSLPISGRRPTYDRDHFVAVAKIYSDAYAVGAAPTKAVAQHFHVTPSAAAKWVARARGLGLLGPTQQRRAGGAK